MVYETVRGPLFTCLDAGPLADCRHFDVRLEQYYRRGPSTNGYLYTFIGMLCVKLGVSPVGCPSATGPVIRFRPAMMRHTCARGCGSQMRGHQREQSLLSSSAIWSVFRGSK